MDIFFISIIND